MERIQDKENRAIYDSMLTKRREEITNCQTKIKQYDEYDKTLTLKRTEVKKSIDLIDEILDGGYIKDVHLRMLVDKIDIKEKNGELSVFIDIKAPFKSHVDLLDEDFNITAQSYISVFGNEMKVMAF